MRAKAGLSEHRCHKPCLRPPVECLKELSSKSWHLQAEKKSAQNLFQTHHAGCSPVSMSLNSNPLLPTALIPTSLDLSQGRKWIIFLDPSPSQAHVCWLTDWMNQVTCHFKKACHHLKIVILSIWFLDKNHIWGKKKKTTQKLLVNMDKNTSLQVSSKKVLSHYPSCCWLPPSSLAEQEKFLEGGSGPSSSKGRQTHQRGEGDGSLHLFSQELNWLSRLANHHAISPNKHRSTVRYRNSITLEEKETRN